MRASQAWSLDVGCMTSCTDVKIQRKAVRVRMAGKERVGSGLVTAFYVLLLLRPFPFSYFLTASYIYNS